MAIRTGETDRFLIDGENWYFVVQVQDGEILHSSFTAAKASRKTLIIKLQALLELGDVVFKLYGVWRGQWRTDLFELEPEKMCKRLIASIE